MKRVVTYIPEKGDLVIVSKKVPEVSLSPGHLLVYDSHISLGIVCVYPNTTTQVLIPYGSLQGIYDNVRVNLTFE